MIDPFEDIENPYDESENQQVEKEEAARYHAFVGDVQDVMKQPGAKKLLMHIISMCDIYDKRMFDKGSNEFRLGRASVGTDVIQLMEDVDPTLYPTLLLERAKEIKDAR